MGVSNEELLKNIRHYQESLDKYTLNKNNYKLLSTIEKLKRLPISTSHLENTGIGRTVNALRKLGGDVGDAAKGLVARWKVMVVEEEEKAKKLALKGPVNNTCPTENNVDKYDENYEVLLEDIKEKENISTSSHISSDTEKKTSEKYRKDLDKHIKNSRQHSSSEKKERQRDGDSSSKKRKQEYSSDSEGHHSKKRHISSNSESEENIYNERSSKSKLHRRDKSESSDEDDKRHRSKKSKYSSSDSDSEDNYEQFKSKNFSSSKDHRNSKSKSVEKAESKKHESNAQIRDESSKSKHKSDIKNNRDSDYEESKSSSKHKNKKDSKSSDLEETKVKSKHESKSWHEKESSKSKESKSHSSRSEKHETKDKKESKPSDSKEKHSHKKDESRKHEEKHKKSKDEKEGGRKDKSSSSSTSKSEENGKSSSSESKYKSGSDRKREKEKIKHVDKEKIVNGIDSGSGASFADALGMCGPVISNKSPNNKKKKSASVASLEKPKASSSYAKPDQYEEDDEENVPSLLKQEPPEPLNINISSLLPELTPHYKPLGLPLDSQPRRILTQDEALSQAISNKNMRTKVYSGNKSYGKVETLFDLCVRVLQDNIDALEYTGGVPYIILKPVLERATPDQLFNMEHHNPYLIEDTDNLWYLHCQKEFRTKKREELESWREMYMRCLQEREARLNAITANIKQSQDKSIPVRTTKLAYVDSFVKPPRNIARKQAKNGIVADKKPAQTPSSRLSALATSGDAGKVAVPNPGSRAADRSGSTSSSSSAAALKPKKAPLMAKTLSLFKNRFRR